MLDEEQTRNLLLAVAHPDLEQDQPVIMPIPVADQMGRHILDAVNGLKYWDKEKHEWVRSEEAAPPMSSKRFSDDV